MSFEGREILTQKCAEILDELRSDFVGFCLDLTRKCSRYVDEDKIENIAENIYNALLSGEFERKKISNELADCFANDKIFVAYLLNAAFLRLLRKFCVRLKKTEVELLYCTAFLSYAIENFMREINVELIGEQISPAKSTNVGLSLTMDSGFSFFSDVIEEFRHAKNEGVTLTFFNLFNGVNVKTEARVLEVFEDSALFAVNLTQILAMKEEDSAYMLKNDNLSSNVKADILSIDLAGDTVLLGNFVRIKNMFASQRKYPRVHPNRHTPVILSCGNKAIEGQLFDISQGGIGVVSMEDAGFGKGDELTAKFKLSMPNNGEEVPVDLKINLVESLNYQGSMRYCCQITKPQEITDKIIEFSKLREKETIDELEQKVALYK